MVQIILTSHGLYAQEAKNTLEMITGVPINNITVVSVKEGNSFDDCYSQIETVYKKIKDEGHNDILILTDIYGGTPANISTALLLTYGDVEIYSGFNIPMLLEVVLSNPATIEDSKKIIEETYKISLVNINEKMKEGNDDGDRMDSY